MAAGTIPLSMTQQLDVYGQPLAGGQLFIIQAGTVSTPQQAYQDTGLTILMPYPMVLDAAGRIPQFFLDNSVNSVCTIRLQDSNGVVQLAADSVLIIGPASDGGGGGGGGGGGLSGNVTQLIQTGMMMFAHTTATIAGFVRCNGRSIGNPSSSGSERNAPDCQPLFQYLWPDTSLAVSGGRGANALADWTANKNIALPDWRGYALTGRDTMGNTSAAGRLTAGFFVGAPDGLGAVGGAESLALTVSHMPSHQHNVFASDAGHTHPTNKGMAGTAASAGINAVGPAAPQYVNAVGEPTSTGNASILIGSAALTDDHQTAPVGGSVAHRTLGPRKLCTFFIKL